MAVMKKMANGLYWEHAAEQVLIQPWGKDSLRFRVTKNSHFTPDQDWALAYSKEHTGSYDQIKLDEEANSCAISNGNITASINRFGWLTITNQDGKVLLEERWQVKPGGKKTSPLGIPGRELKPIIGGDYQATLRLEAFDDEKIYGMGQRQEKQLNYKGCILELAQRNTQATVPFVLSNRGYGFPWNNPAIGQVTFANNETKWEARDTDQLDFWVTAADSPAQTVETTRPPPGRSR